MAVQKGVKYKAANKSELMDTGKKVVDIEGHEIGIFLVDGEIYAWRNFCPHFAAPVCEGDVCGTRLASDVYEYEFGLEGQILRCPWHGWEFDLKTGKHLVDETVQLKSVTVEIEDDEIYVIPRAGE